ncbi:regulatory protein RecX [Williamsia sp. 1135]|uniref:regulatory protein RecX n=1 Tax=Williamsia sp. 1135 TaxID=1889262 RepID=UPI001F0A906A|nr:regulatory protein RecX [Williamsia sp. 1135]
MSAAKLRNATAEILSRSASEDSGAASRETVPNRGRDPGSGFGSTSASAYDAALRLLGVRGRSRSELLKRLQDKDFPAEEIDSVMERLERQQLLDDNDFAQQWVRSRHLHSGKGRTALRHELRNKGVDQVIIEDALSQVDDDAEHDRAAELLRRKTHRLTAEDLVERVDRDRHTRRLVSMLVRRGYSPSLALGLVKTEIDRLRD